MKINDNLIIGNNINDNVIELKEIYEEGAYAPLLESGTISVNNILASCYANIKWHHLAHFVLQPIIQLSNYFDFDQLDENIDPNYYADYLPTNVFWYARYLNWATGYIPFSNRFMLF